MKREAGGPSSRKRKSAAVESHELAGQAPADTEAGTPDHESHVVPRGPTGHSREAPPGAGDDDRISQLPDAILGKIISLLPTKEGARTQTLASPWRHLWRRSAPLNLDCSNILPPRGDDVSADAVSLVLSTHPGPGRRFHISAHRLRLRDEAVVAGDWLRSPALRDLQELLLYYGSCRTLTWASLSRHQHALRVLAMGQCHLADHAVEALHFPHLNLLELAEVTISQRALQIMVNHKCPSLERLFIKAGNGFRSVRINSRSLRSIGASCHSGPWTEELRFEELVIKNAPRLERLLHSDYPSGLALHVSVISAPKLQILGCLSDLFERTTRSCLLGHSTRFEFGSTIIQGCHVDSLTTVASTVRILSINTRTLNLDAVIDFMRCFPCLEKLYIQIQSCTGGGKKNLWRRKHQNLIRSLDIPLKTLVLANYSGTMSQVSFATFFVLNAKRLEKMTLEVGADDEEEFVTEQRMKLQLENRASRAARFRFTTGKCIRAADEIISRIELDLSDPLAC